MQIDRRDFIGLGLAAFAGAALGAPATKPAGNPKSRSWYNGVEIGCITYSYRSYGKAQTPQDIIRYSLESGLGTLELKGETILPFVGKGKDFKPAKIKEMRRMFDDNGISIHICKMGDPNERNAEICHGLGATCMTGEVPLDAKVKDPVARADKMKRAADRLQALCEKNDLLYAFHNHTQIDALTYDGDWFKGCDKLRINFDIGHYTAAMTDDRKRFIDPLAFVEKYHDRIFSIHLKDRTTKAHKSQNLPFGKGDTPLAKLFPFLQKKGWFYYCDIELEYKIPKGSNAAREVKLCNEFCRKAAGC